MRNARSIMLFYGILSGIISIGLTLLQYFTNSYNGNPLSVILFGVIPIFLLVFSKPILTVLSLFLNIAISQSSSLM